MINHKVDKYYLHDVFLHLNFHWFIYWLHNFSVVSEREYCFNSFINFLLFSFLVLKLFLDIIFAIETCFFEYVCIFDSVFCLNQCTRIIFYFNDKIWIQTLSWTTQIMLDRRQKPQCCFVNTTINDRIKRTIISMVWMKILGGQ